MGLLTVPLDRGARVLLPELQAGEETDRLMPKQQQMVEEKFFQVSTLGIYEDTPGSRVSLPTVWPSELRGKALAHVFFIIFFFFLVH